MAEYYDAEGEPIKGDIYTQEDLDKKVSETAKEAEERIKEIEDKAKKLEEKELNFKNLREKAEKMESELKEKEELTKKYQEKEEARKNLTPNEDEKKQLEKLGVTDEEEVKKAMLLFRKLNLDPNDMATDMEYAASMAKTKSDPMGNIASASGGDSRIKPTNATEKTLSADQIDLGKRLGLTNKEIQEYEGR